MINKRKANSYTPPILIGNITMSNKRKLKRALLTVFALLFFYTGYSQADTYTQRIEILYGAEPQEYSGSVFQTGIVYGDFNGGAIWGEDSVTLSIFDSSFVNNRVVASDYSINLYGGAVYLYNSSSTFVNVSFADNRTVNGGALAFSGANSVFFRGDISFNKNYATKKGGALYTDGGDVEISGGVIYYLQIILPRKAAAL